MNIVQRILILLIRGYQKVLSPALGTFFGPAGRCRFEPSCSQYALEGVQRHGVMAGIYLAARRVLRCNPWGPHGHDPVPETISSRQGLVVSTVNTSIHSGHGS
jgi:putative membrane protein insertion efficiency factor